MNEFDFKTLGVVLSMLGGSSGIIAFKALFALPEVQASALDNAIISPVKPGKHWVRSKCKETLKSLFSPIRLFLSILYLGILAGFAYALLAGPENIFTSELYGPLADPLKVGERVLYATMFAQLACVYAWFVALPAWHAWLSVTRAKRWLRERG